MVAEWARRVSRREADSAEETMRKRAGKGEWMLWATPLVGLASLGLRQSVDAWPVEWSWGYKAEAAHGKSCRLNMRSLAVAAQLYSRDYDGNFPPASIGGLSAGDTSVYLSGRVQRNAPTPVGWTGALLQYTQHQEFQFCPSQRSELNQDSRPTRSPTSPGFTDYWLNARLARVRASTLSAPASTFLLGEGNDGADASNATYSKAELPQAWLADTRSPLFRHLGGANYAFADGHVKWLTPGQALRFNGRADPFAP